MPIHWHMIDAPADDPAVDRAAGVTAAHAQETYAFYRDLIRLRRNHPALNDGGMRWLHVGDDVLVFIRESAEESVLVLASRGAADVRVSFDAAVGWDAARPLFGEVAVDVDAPGDEDEGGVRLRVAAPQFAALRLPGVVVPPRR
ncbi:MAG: DUF3459 domain-containing protein [Humibacter sp.]